MVVNESTFGFLVVIYTFFLRLQAKVDADKGSYCLPLTSIVTIMIILDIFLVLMIQIM
jgi:hypothetical protein